MSKRVSNKQTYEVNTYDHKDIVELVSFDPFKQAWHCLLVKCSNNGGKEMEPIFVFKNHFVNPPSEGLERQMAIKEDEDG